MEGGEKYLLHKCSSSLADMASQTINKANTLVLMGDSITEAAGKGSVAPTTGNSYMYAATGGFFAWGNVLLGHRFEMLANLGIGGQTTTQMLARIADVVTYNPKYCHILAGINDIGAGTQPSVIIANLKAMYDYLLSNGITVLAGTITPRTTWDNSVATVNKWIKDYARQTDGIICIDYFSILANASDGLAKTGTLQDVVHPNGKGAFLLGYKLYDTLKDVIKPTTELPFSNADTNNILTNPMLTGDVTGLATSWSKQGTATVAKEASTDLIAADWQTMTCDGTESRVYAAISNAKYTAGDLIYGVVEFDTDLTNLNFINLHLYALKTGVGVGESYDMIVQSGGEVTYTDATKVSGILKTPVFPVPATTDTLLLRVNAKCTGKVRIRRAGVFKA